MSERENPSRTEQEQKLREEVRLSRSTFARTVYMGLGIVSVALGVIGLFLPVFPTTPFLLLAAACFARGSERFYVALLQNRIFGSFIRDWRDGKGIPLRTKIGVIALLWLTMSVTILFVVPWTWAKAILVLIAAFITWFIASQPTKRMEPEA
jgi:uncharacterized protein